MRQLRSITALTVVAILVTATNDGGAQWGPRYLLVAMPSWLLLVAANLGNMRPERGLPEESMSSRSRCCCAAA